MTLRDFLLEQDFEVQGDIVIAEYRNKEDKRVILHANGSDWTGRKLSDMYNQEIGYIYPENIGGDACMVIELKEVEK